MKHLFVTSLVAFGLATAASAQTAAPAADPANTYPPCSATVKDQCMTASGHHAARATHHRMATKAKHHGGHAKARHNRHKAKTK